MLLSFNPSHDNWDVLVFELHFNPISYMHIQFGGQRLTFTHTSGSFSGPS